MKRLSCAVCDNKLALSLIALSLLAVFKENQQRDGSGKEIKEIIIIFIRKLTKSL